MQADSLPAEPQGKPQNTGVGSLSLLQQIFPTQNRTRVSCIAGGFFTKWAIREAQVTQSCLTLCDLMDYIVHGILQARILEWVAFPFSRGSSQPRDWTQVSCTAGRFFTIWATSSLVKTKSHDLIKLQGFPFILGSNLPSNVGVLLLRGKQEWLKQLYSLQRFMIYVC